MSLMMMPFLVGLTKQAVHKCGKCLNDVKQQSLFGLNSMEDTVMTTQVGNFGIILTRRHLAYMAMVVFAMLSIYTFVLVEEELHGHRVLSNTTWNQYKSQCGYEVFKAKPRQAYRNFESHHFGRAVGWEGYVVRVNINDEDPLSLQYHTANILVKMDEPDIPGGQGADIGVTMSELNVEKYAPIIEDLHIGDRIYFNATLINVGDSHHLHSMRAWGLEKIPGHLDVHAHTHKTGRYKVKQDLDEDSLTKAEKDREQYY